MKHMHCRLLFTLAAGSAVAAGCAAAHDDEDDEADEAFPVGIPAGVILAPDAGVYDAGTVAVLDAGLVAIDAGVVVRDATAVAPGTTVQPGVIAVGSLPTPIPVGVPPAPVDAGVTVAPEPCQTFILGICATLPGIIVRHEKDASGAELPVGLVVRTELP